MYGYDEAIRVAVIERLRDVVSELSRHPVETAVIAAAVALAMAWMCRKN